MRSSAAGSIRFQLASMSEYSQPIAAPKSVKAFSACSFFGLSSSDHQLHDARPGLIQLVSETMAGGARSSTSVDSKIRAGGMPVITTRHGKVQGSGDDGSAGPPPPPPPRAGRPPRDTPPP